MTIKNNHCPGVTSYLSTFSGHVVLTFLVVYLSSHLIIDHIPVLFGTFDAQAYIDRIGLHSLIFFLLGFFRGFYGPLFDKGDVGRKVKNWIKFILVLGVFHLFAYLGGLDVDLQVIFDMVLMCWSYFNGFYAGCAFSTAASVKPEKKEG